MQRAVEELAPVRARVPHVKLQDPAEAVVWVPGAAGPHSSVDNAHTLGQYMCMVTPWHELKHLQHVHAWSAAWSLESRTCA